MKRTEKKINIDKLIGQTLKDYRLKSKLTQEKVAEQLGISVKYISRIENGASGIKVETLVNYINLLEIPPNVLFKNLVTNDDLSLQIELSEKASTLNKSKLEFIISIIDLLKNM